MKIDIERLLCSLIECNTKSGHKYNWLADDIITSLRDQGLIYKDGQIIPELRESEGEMIRKALIEMFNVDGQWHGIQYKEILAWLEKQGEQNPNPCDGCINRKGCINCENGELREVEQKPVWNDEDERIYQSIMDDTVQENQLDGKQVDWLRDIKYRYFPQPKSAWSEEDELKIFSILYLLHQIPNYHFNNWLKSLRPQKQWKPSDEQMEALKGVQEGVFRLGILESLYQDLKKLK